jgi:hypothetical protein
MTIFVTLYIPEKSSHRFIIYIYIYIYLFLFYINLSLGNATKAIWVSLSSLPSLLCFLWGLTSQLLLYYVHITLSTCYDWPVNPLLLFTVSAVCVNLFAISCCQRGTVSRETTRAQYAACGKHSPNRLGRVDLYSEGTWLEPRLETLHFSLHWSISPEKYVEVSHDCLLSHH